MIGFDDFKRFLPEYLSPDSQKEMFAGLSQFPPKFDQKLFSSRNLDSVTIFQGDGLSEMPVTNLPDERIATGPVMVISNTCDNSPGNKRIITPSIGYCPILRISAFAQVHRDAGMSESALEDFVGAVKLQKVTRTFFLPKFGGLPEDCVVPLDHLVSCSLDFLNSVDLSTRRLFSLSNLGLYYFVVKLGIHLTRIYEKVDRG